MSLMFGFLFGVVFSFLSKAWYSSEVKSKVWIIIINHSFPRQTELFCVPAVQSIHHHWRPSPICNWVVILQRIWLQFLVLNRSFLIHLRNGAALGFKSCQHISYTFLVWLLEFFLIQVELFEKERDWAQSPLLLSVRVNLLNSSHHVISQRDLNKIIELDILVQPPFCTSVTDALEWILNFTHHLCS